MQPAISFVVPMWNREDSLEAVVRSCLATSRQDIEVIVIDDASTDASLDRARAINDPRLTLIEQEKNLGVCATRSAGIARATAPWVAFVDSDDELSPGSVDRLITALNGVPEDRAGFYSRRQHDGGLISPPDLIFSGAVSFDEYLEVIEKNYSTNCDFFCCVRREAFQVVPYPTERVPELLFHTFLAYDGGLLLSPEVFYLCHHGAANQLTRKGNAVRASDHDMARINAYDRILRAFPKQMKRSAPQLRQRMIERTIIGTAATAGRRGLLSSMRRLGWHHLPPRTIALGLLAFAAPALPDLLRRRRWR